MSKLLENIKLCDDCTTNPIHTLIRFQDIAEYIENDTIEHQFLKNADDDSVIKYLLSGCDYLLFPLDKLRRMTSKVEIQKIKNSVEDLYDINDINTPFNAIKYNQLNVLKWAYTTGEYGGNFRMTMNHIYLAVFRGNMEIVKWYMEYIKCNINSVISFFNPIKFDEKCVYFAIQGNKINMVKHLYETYPRLFTNAIDDAISYGRKNILILLLEQYKLSSYNNMILKAAECGHLHIVKYLLKKNYDCDENAIHFAALRGHLNIIKLLERYGKPCHYSAVDYAADAGHYEIVKYFHSIGIPCSEFALIWASGNNHFDVVKFLIENYPRKYHLINDAIKRAELNNNLDIARFLKEKNLD